MSAEAGKVYLVGAGPGDPGLLTLHAVRVLQAADVIIYDRLIGDTILDAYASDSAERIYAGKLPDRHTLTQEAINALIVQHAQRGLRVVRLKGGDPFVFGRGGEEAEACQQAGVPFEIIPGITSAIAAAAYAGIPVTHRESASSFAVVTGHEDPDKDEPSVDFAALAKAVDTIIILMGMGSLGSIVAGVLQGGMSQDTPVAVIQWGTTAQQKSVTATLKDICMKVSTSGISSPAVIVIGKTVHHQTTLQWLQNRPLFGKTVVVTRSRETASDLAAQLEMLGARVVQFPTIKIQPLRPQSGDVEILRQLPSFDWVVCTSQQSVRGLMDWLLQAQMDVRSLANCKLAAIGSATAEEMEKYALKCDFIPSRFVSETFVQEFLPVAKGKHVLLVQPVDNRQIIAEQLSQAAILQAIHPYQTITQTENAEQLLELLKIEAVDYITFTSSSTVTGFSQQVGFEKVPQQVRLVSIGPATTATLIEAGASPHIQAEPHTIQGLIDAITTAASAEKP